MALGRQVGEAEIRTQKEKKKQNNGDRLKKRRITVKKRESFEFHSLQRP